MSSILPSPRDALDTIVADLGLERGDRDSELEQVRQLIAHPGFDDPDLVDLTELPFVTIDNADSRDLDQALYIEQTDGGFRVDYALADAAWYVRPGTPLWERSMRRGATYYLPDRAIPMLPEALSEGLISLNPNVLRRALVLRIRLDASGATVGSEAFRALIKSRAKLAYDQVARWFGEEGPPAESWAQSLRALRDVGELRMKLAVERGVVPYSRDEPTVTISEDGEQCVLGARRRDVAQAWNEQISLLCNTVGAQMLAEHDHLERVQSIYRVHAPPVERRLTDLQKTIDALVNELGLGSDWRWNGARAGLAEYLSDLPDTLEFDRLRTALERQILRTNRASEFSDQAGPHWALAVEPYVRLSSPMREMVGVFTHKELAEGLGWVAPLPVDVDRATRERVIEGANRARSAQKAIEKRVTLLALDELFAGDLEVNRSQRPTRSGTVVGLRATRVYLLLDDIPFDVKVYVDDLEDRFQTTYDRSPAALTPTHSTAPTLRLGDCVEFVVDRWDKGRQRFILDVGNAQ